MNWANFIHIYQPPTQTRDILQKVVDESYRPVLKVLRHNTAIRLTLNINACLTEQLVRFGFYDVIDDIGQLAGEGRVELTGSAMYHPILPLIPDSEMQRQIELNQRVNESYFKGVYKPRGFFPPEMCYSNRLAQVIVSMGFEWVIVDEIAYNGSLGEVINDRLYAVRSALPLHIFFKERKISTAISYGQCSNPQVFQQLSRGKEERQSYFITGTDGEIYGHHHPGFESFLEQAYGLSWLTPVTISDLLRLFRETSCLEPLASSWSAWEDEIRDNIPYPQWQDPSNSIHKDIWDLANLIIEQVNQSQAQCRHMRAWQQARNDLDRGLHSCQWWWVSCRPWWGTDMPIKGVEILMNAARSLSSCGIDRVLEQASNMSEKIIKDIRVWQDTAQAYQRRKRYLASHVQVGNLLKFG